MDNPPPPPKPLRSFHLLDPLPLGISIYHLWGGGGGYGYFLEPHIQVQKKKEKFTSVPIFNRNFGFGYFKFLSCRENVGKFVIHVHSHNVLLIKPFVFWCSCEVLCLRMVPYGFFTCNLYLLSGIFHHPVEYISWNFNTSILPGH